MSDNVFIGLAEAPSDGELAVALGEHKQWWDAVSDVVLNQCGLENAEWHSYSRKAGWSMRLKKKGRNILYLIPTTDGVVAAFVLGDRGIEAARAAGLPDHVIAAIDSAKKYAEGTGFRFPVDGPEALVTIRKLVAIKLAH